MSDKAAELTGDSTTATESPDSVIAGEKTGAKPLHPEFEARIWQKGKTGNPKGRPKRKPKDFVDRAKDYADAAVIKLWHMANSSKVPAEVRRKCLNDLLDRGYGKVTKVISIKPGQEAPPQLRDNLGAELDSFLHEARRAGEDTPPMGPRQEVLPPLANDPFALPAELHPNGKKPRGRPPLVRREAAISGATLGAKNFSQAQTNSVDRSNSNLDLNSNSDSNSNPDLSRTASDLRDAFAAGVAVGEAMADDPDE